MASPNLPLEISWFLESVDDDLSTLERMTELPRRRDALLRKASHTLAAIAELSAGHGLGAEDWRSIVDEFRALTAAAIARHRSERGVESLLELDLAAQRAERAADVARDILQEYFLALSLSYAA
jgi:hypothetical protein